MPYSYTVLMLIGFLYLAGKRLSLCAACALSLLVMLLVISFYIQVDASNLDHQRYQLQCAPGFLGFAAAGFQWAEEAGKKFRPALIVITLLVVAGLIPSLPLAQKPFRTETEQEYRFILRSAYILPKDAMYFAASPAMLSTTLHVPCSPVNRLVELHGGPNEDPEKTKIYFRDICTLLYEGLRKYDEKISQHFVLRPIVEGSTVKGPIGFYEVLKRQHKD